MTSAQQKEIPLPRLLPKRQVMEWGGISQPTLDRLMKTGKFPRPIYIGCSPRWRLEDLEAWLDHQVAAAGDGEE